MGLQQLIYKETLRWMKEECLSIQKCNGDLYVPLCELSSWIDDSGKKDVTLKGFMENCPEYGIQSECSQWMIRIKYLPYLISRFGIGRISNPAERDKIRGLLERFGFQIPNHPSHQVYFVRFCSEADRKEYCKIGITSTAMKTRLISLRQQIGKLAVDRELEVLGVIEDNDAAALESKIKEKFASLRVNNFENGSTVGKKEIYQMTSELHEYIKCKSTDAEQEI
ncbi:MAG: hypothetical protein OXH39_02850 [Candidatus Poribacteria bacterium]|nr:hypothetical protein [Candidatus Poribacteria bacterium]